MYRLPRALRLRQHHLNPTHHQHIRLPQYSQRPFSHAIRRTRPQTLYRPSGEGVRVQAVRFKKPDFFTWRRFATIVLYSGVVYVYVGVVLRYLDVEIEIVDDEEDAQHSQREGQEAPGDEEAEDDSGPPYYADEDSTFIPMTWATKLPRSFYRGSDPEWQAFVQVARDKPRHKKIQHELVQLVFSGCTQHPSIARQLGKEPAIGKYWLDISFPDGPPQEYERSGIEVSDGFVAWSQQKVSPENQWRINRALWPRAAFDSMWATSKVLAGIQYRRVKQMLGWEGKDPFSPEERYRHAMEMLQKQRERKEVGKTQTSPDGSPSDAVVSAGAASAAPTQPAADNSKNPASSGSWSIKIPVPQISSATTDLPIAMHVFSSTLSKSWNPKKAEPPRGTFVVQGLVEVRGQRGRMLFDVQSCYDPKASKFVAVSAAVRGYKRWNQAPKGGP